MGDSNSLNKFNQKLQRIVEELKPKLLSFPNIAAISTKNWKSQNTTVIIAHLDRICANFDASHIWKKCPIFLKSLQINSDIIKNKPKSFISIFNVLDDKQNVMQIDGKEVILCIQQSTSNNISSLKTPTN